MCGFVGFVGGTDNQSEVLTKMMDRIVHRGPDMGGQFIDGRVALGFRRLSILDLTEAGAQPMANEDGSVVIVFNGEIYNFQELTAELMRAGHIFATRSDTEVLLHGYEQWGKEMLQKLRGMFTFAIWDRKNETLFCARDHFGIKPFYYYQNDAGELLFGSEIKSFLAHPGFKKELNEEQLPLYLSYQYSPGEDTFFKGVKKLMPAHWLEWKAGQLTVQRSPMLRLAASFLPAWIPATWPRWPMWTKHSPLALPTSSMTKPTMHRSFPSTSGSRITLTALRRRNTGPTWASGGCRFGRAVLCQPRSIQAGQGLPVR